MAVVKIRFVIDLFVYLFVFPDLRDDASKRELTKIKKRKILT